VREVKVINKYNIYAELTALFFALLIVAMAVFTGCDVSKTAHADAAAQGIQANEPPLPAGHPDVRVQASPAPTLSHDTVTQILAQQNSIREAVLLNLIEGLCDYNRDCRMRMLECFVHEGPDKIWNPTPNIYKCLDKEPKP